MKAFILMITVMATALALQGCGRVKKLQGNLILNSADPVVLIDKDKGEKTLIAGPTTIKLAGSKSVVIENGANTIELKFPKASITGKDLNNLSISSIKSGQKVDITSKLTNIQHDPSSHSTTQSCRIQQYGGTRWSYQCNGLADIYVCKWGTQRVTYLADTITRTYQVDFIDPARAQSLATLNSERVSEDADTSYGPCIDDSPGYWDICGVFCIYPEPHHHDHDPNHGHPHPR